MKMRYDQEADAFSVRFTDDDIVESEEVSTDVIFDFDKDGRIVAVEILHATSRLPHGTDFASYRDDAKKAPRIMSSNL